MKNALTGLLLVGAASAFALATPAAAQVAGNPGDLHSPTVYTNQVRGETYGYNPGPLGPLGYITAPIAGPLSMIEGNRTAVSAAPCGVDQDFNGRYTAVCGL